MSKWVSVLMGVSALAIGALVLAGLTAYGRSSEEAPPPPKEDTLHVRAMTAKPGDYPVTIAGFGAATALREVAISPEVSGRIIEIHPQFKNGGVVPQGEALFRIDPSLYETQLSEAEAALRQQEATLERIRQEWNNEKARHAALEQTAVLAERDFARAQELENKGVGSKVEVDRAERARLESVSQRDLHARDLEVFPVRIREIEAIADTARAAAQGARQSLERTHVRAPFTGRVGAKMVDVGQVVAPGTVVARLTDDSALEITAPIDSREARDWLQLEEGAAVTGDSSWFPAVIPVDCVIRWAEEDKGASWKGRLERIAGYDPATRMVQVVVSHHPAEDDAAFPLVAGMFCRVEIPGRGMTGVYQLPQQAVTFDDHVYTAVGDRLKMLEVEVLREDGGFAYVASGLEPGAVVVVTRLVDALDNTLLKIDMTDAAAPVAAAAS